MLLGKDQFLSKQKCVASVLNKHFGSTTDLPNLFSWPQDTKMSSWNDIINCIIKKFSFHQSITAIKEKIKIKIKFSFSHVSNESIKRIINNLDIKKHSSVEIPAYCF